MRPLIPRVAAALALTCLLVACDKPTPMPTAPPAPTNAPATASKSANPNERLLGRWERPDGGYVLELRSVDTNGLFTALYLNPNSIHVERAEAVTDKGVSKLTVLLRDVNYPGCIYNLTYDEKSDQLVGRYFQASMQQTYDVTFTRLPAATP